MVTLEGIRKTGVEASQKVMDQYDSFLAQRRAQPSGLGEPELYVLRDTSYVYFARWRESLALSVLTEQGTQLTTDAKKFVLRDIDEQQELRKIASLDEQFAKPADKSRYESFRTEISAMLTRLDQALQAEARRKMPTESSKKSKPHNLAIEVYKKITDFLTFQSVAVEQEVQEKRVAEYGEVDPTSFFPFLDEILAQDFEGDQPARFRHSAIYQLYFYYKDRTSIEDIRLRSKGGAYSHLDNDGFKHKIQEYFTDYTPVDDPYRRPFSARIRQEERNARRRVPGNPENPGLAAYDQIYDRWIVSREGIEYAETVKLRDKAKFPAEFLPFATAFTMREKLGELLKERALPASKVVVQKVDPEQIRKEGLALIAKLVGTDDPESKIANADVDLFKR